MPSKRLTRALKEMKKNMLLSFFTMQLFYSTTYRETDQCTVLKQLQQQDSNFQQTNDMLRKTKDLGLELARSSRESNNQNQNV